MKTNRLSLNIAKNTGVNSKSRLLRACHVHLISRVFMNLLEYVIVLTNLSIRIWHLAAAASGFKSHVIRRDVKSLQRFAESACRGNMSDEFACSMSRPVRESNAFEDPTYSVTEHVQRPNGLGDLLSSATRRGLGEDLSQESIPSSLHLFLLSARSDTQFHDGVPRP
jgi:hypothetical protein